MKENAMQNISTKLSHPKDPVMCIRMTTNFPASDFVANPPAPECDPAHLIREERRAIIFSGADRRTQSDRAALSYRVTALTRNSMSVVYGNLPFVKRFEANLPSGSFLMGVTGDQATEENRQNLLTNLSSNDPFLMVFDDLAASPFFFCARRSFNANFCIIATVLSSMKNHVFERVGRLVVLTQLEKDRTRWDECARARRISIIHEGVDVSEEFHAWFENVDRDSLLPIKGLDATAMPQDVVGTA